VAIGGAEAAVAEAKAKAVPAKAPAKQPPVLPPVQPRTSSAGTTVTQPAPEPPLAGETGGACAGFAGGYGAGAPVDVLGKSPPPALWQRMGFESEADAVQAQQVGYTTAAAFYRARSATGRQQRSVPASPASTGGLIGYLSEADRRAADQRMADLQAQIAGEIREGAQAEAARRSTSTSGSHDRFRQPPAGVSAFPPVQQAPARVRDPVTGESLPLLPPKPRRDAPRHEVDAADAEYRRIAEPACPLQRGAAAPRPLHGAAWRWHR